ncbi:MAG: HAMP domain-containing sensor histidine kinase [Planctomycetota bacterium]|jgi:signal transduction histidine kinase|nr:HAMP domain-containing sensor histidine kinase [Planctomycetota bacterium]
MSSLRRRLVLGGALTAMVAVGLAAVAVGVTDRVLTVRAVDQGLAADMKPQRFRAVARLMFQGFDRDEHRSHDERRPPDERRSTDERRPPDDRWSEGPPVLAWSQAQPSTLLESPAFSAAEIAQIQAAFNPDRAQDLQVGSRQLRILYHVVTDMPVPGGRWRRDGHQPPVDILPVVVALPHEMDAVYADLRQRHWLLASTVLAASALAACGAWLLARSLVRPLSSLAERIAHAEPGVAMGAISVPDAPRELQPVVTRLNDLLTRVANAVQRERRVNADIAHELRTPLAGIRSQLEFAQSDSDEELRRASGVALGIAVEMQAVMENLLSLVRLDAGQVQVQAQEVHPYALVQSCWHSLEQAARARSLECDLALPEDWVCTSDATAMRVVLNNLLANAVAYAPVASVVRVQRDAQRITVSNASELDPALADQACEAFWRADKARSDTGLHCGLGLAIAQRMAALIGSGLTVQVVDGQFCASFEVADLVSAES